MPLYGGGRSCRLPSGQLIKFLGGANVVFFGCVVAISVQLIDPPTR